MKRAGKVVAMERVRKLTALCAALLAFAASSAAPVGATSPPVPHFGHVFLIIGENTDYSHVTATNSP